MGLFKKSLKRAKKLAEIKPLFVGETRSEQITDENTVSAALLHALVNDETITFEEALEIPAVAASIDFISSICARVPVKLYRENGEDTEEIPDDKRVRLLNDDTGDLLNAYQMKKAWVADYFDGRGYIYINLRRSEVQSLNYVEKRHISVNVYPDPIFKDADINIAGKRYYPHEFLRLCRDTKNGVTGRSITETNGQLLSLYYSTLKFEKKLMSTGGGKKGFLTSETRLSEEVIANMREAWRRVFDENSENMMVLNKGTDFKEASATSTELQLNENKTTNSNDIMLLFLLSSKALQGASDDEIVSAIKTACIPIIEQMEAAFNTSLLLEREKSSMYFACDTSKLERGDLLKRYQAYEIALRSRWLQPDEVRYEEDKKPLGLDWIELGLDSVLYNPSTREIYTPNTNQSATVEGRSFDAIKREIHGPDGKIIDNEPDEGEDSSGGGLTDGEESGIIAHREEIISELRSNGFTYEVHIPAMEIDVDGLDFDSSHVIQRRHHVTQEQAKSYIQNAKMSYSKDINGVTFENYISDDGASYVNLASGLIRTAYPSSQYNPGTRSIIDILNKYET